MADEPHSNSTVILGGAAPKAEPTGSSHQNALPIGTMLGEFEIIDLVGEGGFGIVYLAQDHSLHRRVALKEYMPAALASRAQDSSVTVRSERQRETFGIGLRSFVNEARILAQFDHAALVKVYRFWEANGTAYMVMPFFSGKTLQDVLRERDDAPDEAWIRKILSPVMDALAVIHEEQIYHRDIAPDNIMLLPGERPVLLDFGAARRVISDMTQALTVILKPGYAPIEQYAEMPGMKQGPWTDVYALAAVVYFMILNRKPPPAVGRMMQDSYEPLMLSEMAGRYSDRFLQGIDKCLNVKAGDRPQSIAEMRDAIGFGAHAVAPAPELAPQGKAKKAAPKPVAPPKPAPVPRPAPVAEREYEYATEKKSKLPLTLGVGVVIVAAAAGSYAYYMKHAATAADASLKAPVTVTAPQIATASKQPAPTSAPAAPAPLRFATLAEAIDGALAASDSHLGLKLEAPANLTLGNELKLSASSKSDGFLYVFAWDQSSDKIYRLFPNDKDGDNAVKASGSFSVPHKPDAWKFAAGEPVGNLRVFSILSEKPRDFSRSALARDGDFFSTDRKALEAKLSTAGLGSLLGTPQCAPGVTCADHFAMTAANVTKLAPPPPPPPPVATKPATATTKPAAPAGKKTPDSEREYMKRLNKDLDNLLGK